MAVRTTVFTRKTQPSRDRTIAVLMTDYNRLTAKVNERLPGIMKGAADIILRHILPHIPIDTGALRASGKAEAIPTASGGWGAQVSFGGPDNPVTPTRNAPTGIVEYAIFVNWGGGRGNRVAHHFIERGGQEAKREVEEFILTNLRTIKA